MHPIGHPYPFAFCCWCIWLIRSLDSLILPSTVSSTFSSRFIWTVFSLHSFTRGLLSGMLLVLMCSSALLVVSLHSSSFTFFFSRSFSRNSIRLLVSFWSRVSLWRLSLSNIYKRPGGSCFYWLAKNNMGKKPRAAGHLYFIHIFAFSSFSSPYPRRTF